MGLNLRDRVTLQTKSVTKNSIGEEVVAWIDAATVFAEVKALRGSEYYAANQVQQVVDIRVWIRKQNGVSPDMRLAWNGQHYDITAVIPGTGPYRGMLELMAIQGIRNGR